MNNSLAPLRKRMKSTAYARFFSSRRYDRLNNYSLFSLTISSFILIFVTLLQKYSNCIIFHSNTLELIQLIASIIIAILSITVSFASYSIKSEKMRVSGEEINELISKIDHLGDFEWDVIAQKKTKKIRDKYEILKSKSLNHKEFEFIYGKVERKREDDNNAKDQNNKKDQDNNKRTSETVNLASKISNYLPYIPYITISFFSISLFIYSLVIYILRN